ncbi:MAG: glycogen/starch synthase [Balneolaceae bacterium]
MHNLHISAECYPAAKAGGLGDVVGSLPKYLNRSGTKSSVIIPFYETEWILERETEAIFEGKAPYGHREFSFSIVKVVDVDPGFDLYLAQIPGRFDRPGIYSDPLSGYAYWDEMDRSFNFQIAVLEWMSSMANSPSIVHCHDHHTALVPFMMSQCNRYERLQKIPTLLTIHNGEYQGRYAKDNYRRLPAFNLEALGLLDWDGELNALASGIKCAWRVTTVSEGYLDELMQDCHGLEKLLRDEKEKMAGLINGIDTEVWNPETDPWLDENFGRESVKTGKQANKNAICLEFDLDPNRPLFAFIGRLVGEKGADHLPALIRNVLEAEQDVSFLILGTGDPELEEILRELNGRHTGYVNTRLEYNEALAHRIYASADFLLMPSRVEPCGLNQMYAMRYGTVPIVRATGGLADTVRDRSEKGGYGFLFDELSLPETMTALLRAVQFYEKRSAFTRNRKKLMGLDFSWDVAAGRYKDLYRDLEGASPASRKAGS